MGDKIVSRTKQEGAACRWASRHPGRHLCQVAPEVGVVCEPALVAGGAVGHDADLHRCAGQVVAQDQGAACG